MFKEASKILLGYLGGANLPDKQQRHFTRRRKNVVYKYYEIASLPFLVVLHLETFSVKLGKNNFAGIKS